MIVLIGSLIGTVVVAFTMIMQLLEQYLGISTEEPSMQVTGDQFTTASSIESKMAGNQSADDAKKASSSKYVDFDAADRPGGDGGDDGSMMGARPFHGNVVFQPSECAIEMQNVTKSQPTLPMSNDGTLTTPASHQNQSAADRDSQVMSMLVDIQRKMHEQATRTDAQLAFLTAQMARCEEQNATLASDHAAHMAHIERKFQLQDQTNQQSAQSVFQLEQWIRESRAAAAPKATVSGDDAAL